MSPAGRAYEPVPALIDLRTTFSDGAYDPEGLVQMALAKGFRILVLNDHDRMVIEYGLPPLRRLVRKREELNSINKKGADDYLQEVRRLQEKYREVVLIPGTQSAPFYYWTGSPFSGSLTANDHERRLLTMGLQRPEDYESLPVLHNGRSRADLLAAWPALGSFGLCFLIALFFLSRRGGWRLGGLLLGLLSAGLFLHTLFAPASPFDAYHGPQGAAPYQRFIDAVSLRGGLTFWNYPETRSGVRKLGPIHVSTRPYPGMLLETKGYTGFAALYGDTSTLTEPGGVWDLALGEYCRGLRERPPWGIAASDFHQEGESGERLGNFQTVLWLKERTPTAALAAIKSGRMYASRGKHPHLPRLDEFTVSSGAGEARQALSGEEMTLTGRPRIRISLSGGSPGIPPGQGQVRVRLIRSGSLVQEFKAPLPLRIDYTDSLSLPGQKVYYRFDMTGAGTIVSNPIFVSFAK